MIRSAPILALLLVLPACDRFPWESTQTSEALDPEVVERVVRDVLSRLDAAYEEAGPLFIDRIPQIKNDAAARQGIEDWRHLQLRLQSTDPELQLGISRRITERMKKLLAEPEKVEGEGGG